MPSSIDQFISANTGTLLLVGPPGVGKTTLCTQLPEKVWLCHTDDNLKGPVNFLRAHPQLRQSVLFDIPTRDPVTKKPTPRLDRYMNISKMAIAMANRDDIHTLVFELTTLCDIMMDEVRRQNKLPVADGQTIFGDAPIQIQHWGAFQGLLKNFIITLKSSGKLIVFNAHVEARDDENEKGDNRRLLNYIAVPTSLRETLPGYFDEVWFLSTIEKSDPRGGVQHIRQIQTLPSSSKDNALGLKSAVQVGNKVTVDFEAIHNLFTK